MKKKIPKLLVATEFPPNASGGGPSVVRQMLKDWPTDRLSWWSCVPDNDQRFRQFTASHRVAAIPQKLQPQIRFSKLKSSLLHAFWVPWATLHFRRTLEIEKPDVVWVIPHDWSILPIGKVLLGSKPKAKLSLPPFHVSVHDYADAHHRADKFGEFCCQSIVTTAERLYKASATRDVISHPMLVDLFEKTGQPATQILRAGLESEDLELLDHKTSSQHKVIKIAYAGTIIVEEVFSMFIEALKQVRPSIKKPLELHFFGAHSYAGRKWFDNEWMKEHGNLREDELLNELRVCDWGFSPMALTDEDPRYNRFSLPTKFITYLAAGLSVITLGHPESSLIKIARCYEVGLCSCTTNPDELAEQLRTVLSYSAPWEYFKSEIIRCAQTEFNAETMRSKLYECLGQTIMT